MKSKWFELKPKAIACRKKGYSLRMVEEKLGIPRSTLSGWFKGVRLSPCQRAKLLENWHQSLFRARQEAVRWHNEQKQIRILQAQKAAERTLNTLNTGHKNIIELALAMLYLGEGFKSAPETSIGNSNPAILKFFIKALCSVYNFDRDKIRCELHLRADQDPIEIKKYWRKELNIPLENFTTICVDLRTKGSKTYSYYKGVCVLRCGNAAIQRKLIFLAEKFCNRIVLQ